MAATAESPVFAVPQEGRVVPSFAIIGWRWISRNPAAAIAPILLPFIFLYFLHLISPASLFPLEVVGAILFTTQNIGNWVLGDSATWRIHLVVQDLFVASPMTKFQYLFGVAFSNLIAALPAYVALFALLAVARSQEGAPVPLVGWLVLLFAIVILWILFSAVGVGISSRLKSQREIWPIGNLTFTMLGMLSPLYYPIGILPPLWQAAARFFPTTYAALLVQGVLGITPQTTTELGFDALLLVVLAAIGIVIALSLYKWRET